MESMNQSMIELVAQPTLPANGTGQPGGGAGKPAGGIPNIFFGLMLAMVVFYIFLFRGQGRKKKELAKMIKGLKKNDRVVTIGALSEPSSPRKKTRSWCASMNPITSR